MGCQVNNNGPHFSKAAPISLRELEYLHNSTPLGFEFANLRLLWNTYAIVELAPTNAMFTGQDNF